ncbi:MAG TPA: amino acid permease [Thermoleophilaceae bacterium]
MRQGRVTPAAIPAQARLRVTRGLGQTALAAIGLSALGASIYFILGVVAERALALTPFVFGLAGVFFVITTMTYVEANSVHPERGGASTFARYAFDELWSFVAGWAILLDYLIVMAIGSFAVSHYLAAFWGELNEPPAELFATTLVIGFVAWSNVRGSSASRFGRLARIGLVNLVLMGLIVAFGLATEYRPGEVVEAVDFGVAPEWSDLWFAAVLAAVAFLGIEAASGLAGEVRVGRSGLRRLIVFTVLAVVVALVGMSAVGLMVFPVENGATALGGRHVDAPILGIVSAYDPGWLSELLRYAVGAMGAVVLVQAVNGTMLGLSRLTYSLATHRQIPSVLGRLDHDRGTPYVAIVLAAGIALGLAFTSDIEFLAGIFAFGAMLAFTLAHASVIVLRFREPEATRAFRIPLSMRAGRGSIPLPALVGAVGSLAAWVSVIVLHEGARAVGGLWMLGGLVLYTTYRLSQGKSLRKRYAIPQAALQERGAAAAEYGSILVPVFGGPLDDDIVGTAGRLAAEEGDEGEGGAVIEALYVVEVPMSLPLDARVPDDQIARAKKAVARAKEVGEEYEGVVVATAMVRARAAGAAIVSEARRRGVEAIVLAAEPSTRMRGGTLLGGRAEVRNRAVGETTRYVLEKAPCRVILTAAPAGEEGDREGVAP